MYYFDPLNDDQLFTDEELEQYRIVPYQPDLHLSTVSGRREQITHMPSASGKEQANDTH